MLILIFLLENICCGYSLEVALMEEDPSNGYHNIRGGTRKKWFDDNPSYLGLCQEDLLELCILGKLEQCFQRKTYVPPPV